MKKKLERPKRKKSAGNLKLRLVVRAAVLIFPLIFLSYFTFEFRPFQELLFLQVVFLLNIIGVHFQTFGYTISTANFSSIISFDCTAWRQLYIYFALVMLPIGIEKMQRVKGLILLIPLYFYNTFRAAFSILVGTISYDWFKPVHYFLWEFVFLALIFLFWYHWYLNATNLEKKQKTSAKAFKNR